jgi:uncharacterized membrane-anchored protein YhcB (DUF1043 family)
METVNTTIERPEEKHSSGLVWLGAVLVLCLGLANGYLFMRTNQLESDLSQIKAGMQTEMSQMNDRGNAVSAEMKKTMDELNQQLGDSRAKSAFAATRAKTAAEQHADKLVQTLAEEHKKNQEAVTAQIGEVKTATEQAAQQSTAKFAEVSTEVSSVRDEVKTTKSTLDQTIADLKSTRGDLGVQSGLIATNSKELSALREMGERNYFEFDITKANKMYKVGNVVLTLKKTDPKRNKYNLDLVADDKHVEKKDKNINEPVQFYVSGARQPYELVVNQVTKDHIVGYLATPKVVQARR